MSRRFLVVLASLLLPLAAFPLEGPHAGVFGENCDSCHTLHGAAGVSLTNVAGNANLCFSCHNRGGAYFGEWNELTAQAVPGVSGHSHSWSGVATGHGATAPAPGTPMGDALDAGKLQCSTCHDQHNYDQSTGATMHVSTVVRLVGTTGTVALDAPPADAIARGYLLEIAAGGAPGTATFRISHDGRTWRGWNGAGWVDGESTGKPTGTNVTVDDPRVTVDFSGTFAQGDRYRFYIGRRYLRTANTEAVMCTTCHQDRNQTWQNVEGSGNHAGTGQPIVPGTTVFSHPVNQLLGENGLGHDRTSAAILDSDGGAQTPGDGIPSNDLVLSGTSKVTCLTCHAPHSADSNSLTTDPR